MKRQALTNKSDGDTITCLTCMPGYAATKSFVKSKTGKVEKRNFNSGKFFYQLEYPISGITELSKALKDIETTPNVMLIRGKPLDTINAEAGVQRTGSGEGNHFQGNFKTPDQGRYWVLIDIDKMVLPESLELSKKNLKKVINWVAKQLPPELQDVSFHWQLSSSAGVETTKLVSIHFWFWLTTPVTNKALKAWAKAFNENSEKLKIDLTLFSHVQPHYTAKPIFVGVEDPFPDRSGLVLKKRDEATIVVPEEQHSEKANNLATEKPADIAPSATGFNASRYTQPSTIHSCP